jgi:hypothetical protein
MKSGENESVSWRKLREFAGIDLTQSFVLSWQVEAETLAIDIDLHLEPEHPFYEKPRPAEKVCIRPAVLEFPYFGGVSSVSGDVVKPIEIVDKIGHGTINDLAVFDDGRYEIRGGFGTVSIKAERPILRLKGSQARGRHE